MTKYFIHEGSSQEQFHAGSKARKDAAIIAEQAGYTPFRIPTEYGVQTNPFKKPLQMAAYNRNLKTWMEALDFFAPGDLLLIQYPLVNTASHFERFLQEARKKGVKTAALIHDMDSLRFTPENSTSMVASRVEREDALYLALFDTLIVHNAAMAQILKSNGIENLIELELFDYLHDAPVISKEHHSSDPVVIAGNLDPNKAGYLKDLNQVPVRFRLYGPGYCQDAMDNVIYAGKADAESIPDLLDGSFGLVWDGASLVDCDEGYGEYLRYNNPHKLSLYLLAGLPVIVWAESACAGFVQEHEVGFAIHSLYEIENIQSSITEEEYARLCENTRALAEKIRKGTFLRTALEKMS